MMQEISEVFELVFVELPLHGRVLNTLPFQSGVEQLGNRRILVYNISLSDTVSDGATRTVALNIERALRD